MACRCTRTGGYGSGIKPGLVVLALLTAAIWAAPAAAEDCVAAGGRAAVAAPRFVRTIATGETGWFASPGLVDLTGDGRLEIVAPFYSTFVFDAAGRLVDRATATSGRIYAPGVVADLDVDGAQEIVVGGNEGTVAAYELRQGRLQLEPGWPASTCSGGQCPEARGMAAADLDGDGRIEVVVTTTNTSPTGSQVFVFDSSGASVTGWPRYNRLSGPGNDADFNGAGNRGYGAYGENVGTGNLDDDPELEIVVTFDNHQINVFNHDGTSVLASPWYTNRQSEFAGRRLGWGQFIRWLNPKVEDAHYHRHAGPWPDVRRTMWLQWTASPPSVADLDRDGRNEVIGLPNAELKEPYETQAYAFVVLDGAQGGGARSARRHPGFVRPPLSGKPAVRPAGDWYPPSGIPAPTVVDIAGDARPEIVASVPDGFVYAVGPTGRRLWRFDYARGRAKTFASEVVADLNRDGRPELVFGTYALAPRSGRLVVLSATGRRLHDVRLPRQGRNGNGIGIAAAPSIADLDGNGSLEIVVTTFDHGIDVFRVPGSGANCLPWPTGRGNLLRNGTGPATVGRTVTAAVPATRTNGRLAVATSPSSMAGTFLVSANPDGSGAIQILTGGLGYDALWDPAWSPDGMRIAFRGRLGAERDQLYVTNGDGTGTRRLTWGPSFHGRPSWSPDGRTLAFEVSGCGGTDAPQGCPGDILTVGVDGRRMRYLTRGSTPDGDPAWSPDGRRIAFTSARDGNQEIYVMNADGTGVQRLTSTGEAVDADPSWSPDGTQIAFESNREGSLQLWVMAADGSGQRRLTDQPDGATDAAWSPDGSEIAFTSDEDAWTVHPDGSSPRLVTLSYPSLVVYLGGAPSWQPLGPRPAGCTLWGTPGRDLLVGTPAADRVCGLDGEDTIVSRDRAKDAVDGGRDRAFADPRDRVRRVELVRRRDPTWGDLRP